MPVPRTWTPQEVTRLTELAWAAAGKRELVRAIPTKTWKAIRAKLDRIRAVHLDMPRRRREWKTSERQAVIQAYEAGEMTKNIAFDLDRSHGTIKVVLSRLRKEGLVGYRQNWREVP